jgi:hypothetical protein
MTPKKTANLIANKMYNGSPFEKTTDMHILEVVNAKRCALIAVDLILDIVTESYDNDHKNYWEQVKIEIQIL